MSNQQSSLIQCRNGDGTVSKWRAYSVEPKVLMVQCRNGERTVSNRDCLLCTVSKWRCVQCRTESISDSTLYLLGYSVEMESTVSKWRKYSAEMEKIQCRNGEVQCRNGEISPFRHCTNSISTVGTVSKWRYLHFDTVPTPFLLCIFSISTLYSAYSVEMCIGFCDGTTWRYLRYSCF